MRIRRRARDEARHALVRVFGRKLVCSECGRPILKAIAFVWRGKLRIFGAEDYNVHVVFCTKELLEFRHMELDRCPSPERPWVS